MLRRVLHDITGMRIHATDGDLGHVRDVYFEDAQWRVRYLEVDTGHWLPDRHVLLAPTAVHSFDWQHDRILVSLTREQVRNSPDMDSHKPVSRQHTMQLHEYFQWPFRSSDWVSEDVELAVALHKLLIETRGHAVTASSPEQTDDPHLWSARALAHYGLEAADGDLGRVDDFLVHPDTWTIRHLVIARGSRLRGKEFLVPVERIKWISWDAKRVRVGGLPLDRVAGTNR